MLQKKMQNGLNLILFNKKIIKKYILLFNFVLSLLVCIHCMYIGKLFVSRLLSIFDGCYNSLLVLRVMNK